MKKRQKRPILNKNCTNCNIQILTKDVNQKYCSRQCKHLHQKITQLGRKCPSKYGKENPNYGKRWSEEKRKLQSDIIKSRFTEESRKKCGDSNRGKKFSPEKILRLHGHRTRESYIRVHSEETKNKISQKSKLKFLKEGYREKVRKTMEERGLWHPLSKKLDKEIYFQLANWNHRMFDILHEKYGLLMKEFGVFNKNNTKGVVRDHAYSRKSGFINGVFPEILRHVENCQIISHANNIKKFSRGDDDITLAELFENIKNTKHEWFEQHVCLELIKEYENGKRWVNPHQERSI